MGQVVVGGLERGGVGVWGRVDRGGGKNQGGEVTRCENGGQTQSITFCFRARGERRSSVYYTLHPPHRSQPLSRWKLPEMERFHPFRPYSFPSSPRSRS